jgi:hypothetical protein
MKPGSGDDENESTEMPWPRVLRIASSDEFRQSFAVAQLAVKLCTLKKAESKVPLERENLTPGNFLAAAWELIQSAREHVSRPQTNAEYLVAHGGSHEAAENVVGRIRQASLVPFQKLCDPEYHNKEDSVTFHGQTWNVYRSERGFDDLFWAYWCDFGEKWKDPKQAEEQGKLRFDGHSVQMYSEEERQQLAQLARDADAWKQRGKQKLGEWKRDGIPPADFLALARFRSERDNRSENLKPKPKRRRLMAKGRA